MNSTMFIYGLKNMIQQNFSFVYLYEWCLANIYLDLNKKIKSQFIRFFPKSKLTYSEHKVKSRVQDQIFLWQNPLPLFAYNGKQYYWYFLLKIRSGRNVRFSKSVRCMFVVNIWLLLQNYNSQLLKLLNAVCDNFWQTLSLNLILNELVLTLQFFWNKPFWIEETAFVDNFI